MGRKDANDTRDGVPERQGGMKQAGYGKIVKSLGDKWPDVTLIAIGEHEGTLAGMIGGGIDDDHPAFCVGCFSTLTDGAWRYSMVNEDGSISEEFPLLVLLFCSSECQVKWSEMMGGWQKIIRIGATAAMHDTIREWKARNLT